MGLIMKLEFGIELDNNWGELIKMTYLKTTMEEIERKRGKMELLYQSSNSGFLRGYTEALRYCLNKFKKMKDLEDWDQNRRQIIEEFLESDKEKQELIRAAFVIDTGMMDIEINDFGNQIIRGD